MIRFFVLTAGLALSLIACDEVDPKYSVEQVVDTQAAAYRVLRRQDYIALTGCDVSISYDSSVQIALDFLVFDEEQDKESIGYVRRETTRLFEDLLQDGGVNLTEATCLTGSLRRIGEEIGLLVSLTETEFDYPHAVRFDPDEKSFPDETGLTYAIQSRSEYMKSTECLVSPSSYDKFQNAFETFIYDNAHPEAAPVHMTAFLSDVRDSRPLPDGSLNPQCLTPGLLKFGKDMGVLTEAGKLTSQNK